MRKPTLEDVTRENELSRIVNREAKILIDFFKGKIGCKILKKRGGLMESVKNEMPTLDKHTRMCSNYSRSLFFQAGTSEKTIVFYIGMIENGTLICTIEQPNRREDWDYEDVIVSLERIKELEEQIYKLKSHYHPFV